MRWKLVGAAVLTGCLLGAGAGCSGDQPGEDEGVKQPPRPPAAKAAPSLPTAPPLKDSKGAIGDVSFGECPVGEGEQRVTGTVKNSGDRAADYVITVSWVGDSSDVRARSVTVVRAAPKGESKDFTTDPAPVPAGQLSCTFLVQRGALK